MSLLIRRSAVVLFLLPLLLLTGCPGRRPDKAEPVPAAENADRLAYLTELGWQTDPEPLAALVLRMPVELQESYGDYLKLQEQQGFDFAACAGKTVSRYTYAVTNYPGYSGPVQVNLWVLDGLLTGGDVTAPGDNGFQTGLAFPGRRG